VNTTAQTDTSPPQSRAVLAALCVVSGMVLFLLRADEISGMSSGFAAETTFGIWNFFPHHLFFQPMVRIFHEVFGILGCDIVCAGQVHSIAWSVAAIASTYIIAMRLTRSPAIAIGTSLFVMVSNGFWIFSTQLEPYAPLLGLDAMIAAILLTRERPALNTAEILTLTGLFTFSLFFHQANIFFLIPIAIYMLISNGRSGLLSVVIITALSGFLAAGINAITFWTTHPGESFGDFYRWLTYYGTISNDAHGSWRDIFTLDPARIRNTLRSTVMAFVAAPAGALQMPVRLLVAAAIAVVVGWNAVQAVVRWPHSSARLFILLWTITFGLFFYWWLSNVYKFYIVLVMPVGLLAALMLHDLLNSERLPRAAGQTIAGGAAATVVAVAALNLVQSVWPLAHEGSPIETLSGKLDTATPERCSIYTERSLLGYLGFYHGREGRPFNLMFRKYHYTNVNPDVARAIRVSIDLNAEDCAVIPLAWLSEEYFNTRNRIRTSRLVDGTAASDSETPSWQNFLDWILDVRADPATGALSHNSYRVFAVGSGDSFVEIDRAARTRAASREDIYTGVDIATRTNPLGGFAGEEYRQTASFRQRAFGYF